MAVQFNAAEEIHAAVRQIESLLIGMDQLKLKEYRMCLGQGGEYTNCRISSPP